MDSVSFTIIHGKVYDISSDFLQWHPGGQVAATQVPILCRPTYILATNYLIRLVETEAQRLRLFMIQVPRNCWPISMLVTCATEK